MDLQSRGGGQAVGSDAKHDLVENDSLAPQVVFEPQELQEIQDAGHFETAALHLTSEQATSPEDKGCARDATKTEASTENSKDRAEEAPRSRPGTSSTKEDKKGSGVSTRTIEVQTDPIDDLDRYCIDVSTSTETSPRNTPKDSQVRCAESQRRVQFVLHACNESTPLPNPLFAEESRTRGHGQHSRHRTAAQVQNHPTAIPPTSHSPIHLLTNAPEP